MEVVELELGGEGERVEVVESAEDGGEGAEVGLFWEGYMSMVEMKVRKGELPSEVGSLRTEYEEKGLVGVEASELD